MLPHPDTVCVLNALDYQQRLQDAAKERIAASAQVRKGSSPANPGIARRIASTWFGALRMHVIGSIRRRLASPVAIG